MTSYWNYEISDKIICPYCQEEYEPSYEDTYIGGESIDCYSDDEQQCTCDRCGNKFSILPFQVGWNYETKTIDGEASEEELEERGFL